MNILNEVGTLGGRVIGEGAPIENGNFWSENRLTKEERVGNLFKKIDACYKRFEGSSLDRAELNSLLLTSITLADLRAAEGCKIRDEIVVTLDLKKKIEFIDQQFFPFFERLKTVSYKVLDEVSLLWIKLKVNVSFLKSPLAHALITDMEFVEIPQNHLLNRKDLRIFVTRLNDIFQTNVPLILHLTRLPPIRQEQGLTHCSAARLRVLSCQYLHKCAGEVVDEAWGILDDSQIQTLNFQYLSPGQIEACVRGGIDDSTTIHRRFLALSSKQLEIVIPALFRRNILQMLPLEVYKKINLSKLKDVDIHDLFCSLEIKREEALARVAELSINEINQSIPSLRFDFFRLLTDDQIRALDYTQLTREQLERGFCGLSQGHEERSRRIQLIPVEAIPLILSKGANTFRNYFSEEQKLAVQ